MPFKRQRKRGRKSKFVTKRGLPFQMMKYVETKFQTITETAVALTSGLPSIGPQFASLTLFNQGVDQFERIGNMVQVTGIYIRMIHSSILDGNNQWVRVTLTTPRDVNGGEQPISGMTIPVNPDKHIVWHDKTYNSAFQPGGGNGVIIIRKKFKPYLKVMFDDDAGSSITKGNVQLTIVSHNNLGVEMSYTVRVFFKDM